MDHGTPADSQHERDPGTSVPIAEDEVARALRTILASVLFRNAPRHRRFLRFVVTEKLADRTENLKESVIGVEVFDRPADYDPSIDSTVRAEARRLRTRLTQYYSAVGRDDPIHIELPKGTYVPDFIRDGAALASAETAPEGPEMESKREEVPEIAPPSVRSRWSGMVVATAVLVLAAAILIHFLVRKTVAFNSKGSIVLGDIENKTGNPIFDDSLRQALAVQMTQSPYLYLLPDRKIGATLSLMGRATGDRLTPEVTREICVRTNSTAMLTGWVTRLGSQYVIDLKAVDCNAGEVLGETKEQAKSDDAVLEALDTGAIDLRSKLGESIGSVEKYSTPLKEATTPSLEALRAYSLGVKTSLAQGDTAALPFFKRAVELDPNFAIAYNSMASSYNNLGEIEHSQENVRKAYELRSKLSEHERLNIEATYYLYVTGELEKAAQVYEQWQQLYPRDYVPYTDLAFIYGNLGSYEAALRKGREALLMEPNDIVNYTNQGNDYAALNRLDDAEAVYKQADDRKLQAEYLLWVRYLLAFDKGDKAQMDQLFSAAMGKPGTEDILFSLKADTEAYYGQWKSARELIQKAIASAERNNANETAAGYEAGAALREAALGYKKQARADATAALRLASNRDVRSWSALALAWAGETSRAGKLADELDKSFPLDTLVQKYRLPTIRAAISLGNNDPSKAIALLETARQAELGDTGFLFPIYVRGQAYLSMRNSNAAAAEFRKFVDHYGLVANSPWGALARLGMARTYALDMKSDRSALGNARIAYQNFLTLWKDGDSDIPIFQQAKVEYAKLQ